MKNEILLVLGISILFSECLIGNSIYAQDSGIVELKVKGHPRLFFTKAELPSLRDKAKDTTGTEQGVSTFDLWLAVLSKAREGDILCMCLVYHMLGKPGSEEAEKQILDEQILSDLGLPPDIPPEQTPAPIKERIFRICRKSNWGSDFDLATNTREVAIGYDAIYETLSPEERDTIRKSLISKGISPLLALGPTGVSVSNIRIIQVGALGLASLVLMGEEPKAAEWATTARARMIAILERNGMDGGYGECTVGYGTIGFDGKGKGGILFFDALKRVTGDNSLLTHPWMKKLMYFAMHTMRPGGDGGVGFNDTWQGSGFHLTVLRVAGELNNGHGMWYLQKTGFLRQAYSDLTHPTSPAPAFLFFDPEVRVRSPAGKEPVSKHFRGIGWVTLRTSWEDDNGILFAMQTEHSKHYHEHNAMNHFEIHGYRSRLATSPGYHHGRKWRATLGHNLLWVDGEGQNNSMIGPKGGKIAEFLGSSFFDYVVGQANPYGTSADPLLDFWHRHVVFAKPDYLIVFDHVKASKERPRKFSWLLQVTVPHAIVQKGKYKVDGDEVTSCPDRGLGQLFGKVMLPREFTTKVGMYSDKWFPEEIYGPYYELTPEEKKTEENFLVVLYPQPRNSPEPAIRQFDLKDGKGVEIEVPSGRNIHVYRVEDGEVTDNDWKLNGENCMISLSDDDSWVAYALCGGTRMEYKGRLFLSSGSPVIAAFSRWKEYELREGKPHKIISSDEIYGIIQLKSSQEVRFYVGDTIASLDLNGKPITTYGCEQGVVTISLPQGESRLVIHLKKR